MQVSKPAWIHSAAVDLIVGCGAWSAPLLLLAFPFAAGLPAGTTAFYALALLLNYPHYMATIYRAYHNRGDFERYGFYTKTLTAMLLLLLVAAHASYRLVPWLFTLYITWSPWHYMGQNFGLLMMFVRRSGMKVEGKDRRALWTAFVASYLMIFLSFHTNPSFDPYVVSLGLPSLLDLFRIPLLFIFLILGIYPLRKLVRKAGWRAMAAPIVLYATEFLWFVAPTVVELVSNIRVPSTRYSAGVLAVMHSAQYLWITSYYARREDAAWKSAAYFGALVAGGIALFVPVPWMASWALGRDFTTSFLIVTAIVNIHHFMLDGAVWKLRERRVASLLVPTPGTPVEEMVTSGTLPSWARKGSVRLAVVAALLALAGLDQARHFLTAPGRAISSLATAATLNPHDAPLLSRLGRASALSGDYAGAERTLEDAIRSNPGYAPAHLYLGNVIELQGNSRAALSHYERCQNVARASRNKDVEQACSHKVEELSR